MSGGCRNFTFANKAIIKKIKFYETEQSTTKWYQ